MDVPSGSGSKDTGSDKREDDESDHALLTPDEIAEAVADQRRIEERAAIEARKHVKQPDEA